MAIGYKGGYTSGYLNRAFLVVSDDQAGILLVEMTGLASVMTGQDTISPLMTEIAGLRAGIFSNDLASPFSQEQTILIAGLNVADALLTGVAETQFIGVYLNSQDPFSPTVLDEFKITSAFSSYDLLGLILDSQVQVANSIVATDLLATFLGEHTNTIPKEFVLPIKFWNGSTWGVADVTKGRSHSQHRPIVHVFNGKNWV